MNKFYYLKGTVIHQKISNIMQKIGADLTFSTFFFWFHLFLQYQFEKVCANISY